MKMKEGYSDYRILSEGKASQHINVVAHYKDDTLIDKSAKLIKIIKLSGIDPIAYSTAALNILKNRRNGLFRNFDSSFGLYSWTVRRKTTAFPSGEFPAGFARTLNERYRQKIESRAHYHDELYLALMTKPPEGIFQKNLYRLQQLSLRGDRAAKERYLAQRSEALDAMTGQLLQSLADYQPEILTTYSSKQGTLLSESLGFLSQLLNFYPGTVPRQMTDASRYLLRQRIFFNRRSGTIEMRFGDQHSLFAAMIGIKEYTPGTFAGILDQLRTLKIEYTLTQSYRFYDRQLTKTRLRDQQNDLRQTKEDSYSQTEQLSESFDEAASGQTGFGSHHFSLLCYGENLATLNKNVGEIIALLADVDIAAVREDLNTECAYWAQLPGNFNYIARPAPISTKNLASFMSLHNDAMGKIKGNYWGDAVTVLETMTGAPYYFNFHYRDIGLFLCIGSMGSGKTLLIGFLIAQSLKFGGKQLIFDKDRGLDIMVRALGGTYEVIKPGMATRLNPCQLPDNAENRQFLMQLFKVMLKPHDRPVNEAEEKSIEEAVKGLYRLDQTERQFCNLAPFFGSKTPGSLRARFDRWHSGQEHAWLFDNPDDSLTMQADVIGIDLTHIFKLESCKTPLLMYVTHRFRQAIMGTRGKLYLDEGWAALNDVYFSNLINDLSRTPRKEDLMFGLATQSPSDTGNAAVNIPINESARCKLFAVNPTADRALYCEKFGLPEQAYQLIKTLPDDHHYFVLQYGLKEIAVVRLNLTGMEKEIAVISGRKHTVALLDEIRAEQGDDPKVWLPIFYERLEQLKEEKK
jgi:type IV secretion system protein VirB4